MFAGGNGKNGIGHRRSGSTGFDALLVYSLAGRKFIHSRYGTAEPAESFFCRKQATADVFGESRSQLIAVDVLDLK